MCCVDCSCLRLALTWIFWGGWLWALDLLARWAEHRLQTATFFHLLIISDCICWAWEDLPHGVLKENRIEGEGENSREVNEKLQHRKIDSPVKDNLISDNDSYSNKYCSRKGRWTTRPICTVLHMIRNQCKSAYYNIQYVICETGSLVSGT